jgi:hypothetical protein
MTPYVRACTRTNEVVTSVVLQTYVAG